MRKFFTAMALSMAVAGLSTAASAETWDMPLPYPDSNFHTKNTRMFAEDVAKLSGGKLNITIHSGASLFKMPEIKRAVRTGQAQAGEILLSAYGNENAVFEADGVPFLATGYDNALKLYKAQKPVLEKLLAEEGLMLLYAAPWPGQGLFVQSEIASVEGMKGVKFRAYNAATSRFAELAGAVPTTVQYAEVPQAFSTGLVSSMLTSGATGVDVKAWDFVKVFYQTDAMHPKNIVFVNKRAFDGLDKATQDAVLKAAADAETRIWAASQEEAKRTVKALGDNGMKVLMPSDKLQKDLKAIGDQMVKEWLEKAGADGKTIVDAYNKM
ncbi:TRAP transporter substrate-binding protein [Oceanibaculum nanhaiense]|jgi:TRAP-type C4-dicarboxylate transport system substrate-binding protein|uniref:TRAP transporter substrate-binding protein n=1 Tax=Oceanibaculum nanhaiense TaxID=1909734 RepID=UPI00198CA30D|nr:TRAP transporter substrate-binding protein [Oceanibaculum nanhaiense]